MSTVTVEVNQQKLVQHLRSAFSTGTTFLKELLQNARRAKATQVDLEVDCAGDSLIIKDDGNGIADFQVLFSLADSGWDAETVSQEGPYGLGFLSALFAARVVEVESLGKRVSFSTEDALNFDAIDVVPCETAGAMIGTVIRLNGLSKEFWRHVVDDKHALCIIEHMCKGFPIPVCCNGSLLKREHALDSGLIFEDVGIGSASIVSIEEDLEHVRPATHLAVYLQGFLVSNSSMFRGSITDVIHLDSKQFRGRLPDRESLVNHHENINLVRDVIKERWRSRLCELVETTDPLIVASRAYRLLETFGMLDLLNDNPYLPPEVIGGFRDVPKLSDWDNPLGGKGPALHRSVVPGYLVKGDFDPERDLGEDPVSGSFASSMWAYLRDKVVLDGRLDGGHWVYQKETGVDQIGNRDFWLELCGESQNQMLNCTYLYNQEVVICERAVLHRGDETLDVPLGFFYEGPVGGPAADDDENAIRSILVIPSSDSSGNAVLQAFNYEDDNGEISSTERDGDIEQLSRLIAITRKDGHLDVLRRILLEGGAERYAQGRFEVVLTDRDVAVKAIEE
ncbi:hypothetical protein BJI67_16270 (plasmid) [Acidihalobacter aeolianus]|uniref:ATP-binding protein n=1 Tax=Acidihalobacter aeolianus TaxID=2792603 RepID=A0A1D8KCV4_9GAMM|nr:ATP-binding protein [Acidihalobacter aeolianus]AOV18793.1 hypothetical protein BJI67_16270 [Acidihalobacter aeolianus]